MSAPNTTPPLDTWSVGARLRVLRKRAGVSQLELARRGGDALGVRIEQASVARIEIGRRVLKYSEAVVFAQILDVDLYELIPEERVDAA